VRWYFEDSIVFKFCRADQRLPLLETNLKNCGSKGFRLGAILLDCVKLCGNSELGEHRFSHPFNYFKYVQLKMEKSVPSPRSLQSFPLWALRTIKAYKNKF